MSVKALFEFGKGQFVPSWLYLIRDEIAAEVVLCSFGTSGRCALIEDGSIVLWPGPDRKPEEYIFTIENGYYENASAGHPAGDQFLTVLSSEGDAREILNASVDDQPLHLPESDPRA